MRKNAIKVRIRAEDADITLALNPQEIRRSGSPRIQSIDTADETHEYTDAPGVTIISWDGLLPGEERKNKSYISRSEWRDPREIDRRFDSWRETGRVVLVTVSWWGIRERMFVGGYESVISGGHGDIRYSIEFRRFNPIGVRRKDERGKEKRGGKRDKGQYRDDKGYLVVGKGKGPETYTAKQGDTIWTIARRKLGSVTEADRLWDLNKDRIRKKGGDRKEIVKGTVLIIPKQKDS